MSQLSPLSSILSDEPSLLSQASGQSPSRLEEATPAPEYAGSYDKRAKGKTAKLESLLQTLEYWAQPCPKRAAFIYTKKRPYSGKSPGSPARTTFKDGQTSYGLIYLNGIKYLEHRLLWLWFYGDWPQLGLDHVDGEGLNNTIENIKEATQKDQCHNRKLRSDNQSGYAGISWRSDSAKWRLILTNDNGVIERLGTFANLQDAVEARDVAYASGRFTYTLRHQQG